MPITRTLRADAPRMLVVATVDRFVRFVLPHLAACRARGWRVDIACHVTDFADEMQANCDHLYETPFRRFPVHPLNALAYARVASLLRAHRYDIVHAHTPAGGIVGRAAATAIGVPVRAYTAHGFHFHPEGGRVTNAVFSSLERYAGHHWSDWVEVINQTDYDLAQSWSIVPLEKLLRIEGVGVDAARFHADAVSPEERSALRREYYLPDDGPVLGTVAEMIPRKRLADAISALALLRPEYPKATLLLLGAGPLRAALEKQAMELGVYDACRFLGFRRDTPRHLALMDAFVFPSQQEGLPVALMEAMSMEAPVIATDIRGSRDLIQDGVNGLLVPVAQPRAIADAWRRIVNDPSSARKLGTSARRTILETYELGVVTAKQLAFYDEMLHAARADGRLRRNVQEGNQAPLASRGGGGSESEPFRSKNR